MSRKILESILADRGEYYAAQWLSRDEKGPKGNPRFGPKMVLRDMHNLTYKDEFEVTMQSLRDNMGKASWAKFEAGWKKIAEPRTDAVLAAELKTRLAITPDGEHIEGSIGTVSVGGRRVGTHIVEVEAPYSIARRKHLGLPKTVEHREVIHKIVKLDWPIYAGEEDERSRPGGGAADPIPGRAANAIGTFLEDESGALNLNISQESLALGLNAAINNLDEGTLGCIVVGYGDTIATEADAAVGTQTKLFTCQQTTTTSFGAAADTTGSATKTANTFADDTSADATEQLNWCRASSSSGADTALDDHLDGSAGTATVDWVFNTVAIQTGATVSITSWTVAQNEDGA